MPFTSDSLPEFVRIFLLVALVVAAFFLFVSVILVCSYCLRKVQVLTRRLNLANSDCSKFVGNFAERILLSFLLRRERRSHGSMTIDTDNVNEEGRLQINLENEIDYAFVKYKERLLGDHEGVESEEGEEEEEDQEMCSSSESHTLTTVAKTKTMPRKVSSSGYSPMDEAEATEKTPSPQSLSAEKHVSFDISQTTSTDEMTRLKPDDGRMKKCSSVQKADHQLGSEFHPSLTVIDRLTVGEAAHRGRQSNASRRLTVDEKDPLRRQRNGQEKHNVNRLRLPEDDRPTNVTTPPRPGIFADKRATITVDIHHDASGHPPPPPLGITLPWATAPTSAAVDAGALGTVVREPSEGRQWTSLELDRQAVRLSEKEVINTRRRVRSCEDRSTAMSKQTFVQDPFGITEFITGPGSDEDGDVWRSTTRETTRFQWPASKFSMTDHWPSTDHSQLRSSADRRPTIDHSHVTSSIYQSMVRPSAGRHLVRQRSRSDDLQSTTMASLRTSLSAADKVELGMMKTRHSQPLSRNSASSTSTINDRKLNLQTEDRVSHRKDAGTALMGSLIVHHTTPQQTPAPPELPTVVDKASKGWTENFRALEKNASITSTTETEASLSVGSESTAALDGAGAGDGAVQPRPKWPHPKASSFDSVPTDYDASESSHCEVTTTSIESTAGSSSSASADSKAAAACKLHQMRDDSGYKSLETQTSLGRTAAAAAAAASATGSVFGGSTTSRSVDSGCGQRESFVRNIGQSLSETQRTSLSRFSILSRQIKQSLRIAAPIGDLPHPVKSTSPSVLQGGHAVAGDGDGADKYESSPRIEQHLSPSGYKVLFADVQLRRARSDSQQGTTSNLALPKKSRSEEADPFQRRRLADQPTVTKTLSKGLTVIRQHAGQYFTSAVTQAEHLLAKVRDYGDSEAADAEQVGVIAGRESTDTTEERIRVSLVDKRHTDLHGAASVRPGEVGIRDDLRGQSSHYTMAKDVASTTRVGRQTLNRPPAGPAAVGVTTSASQIFRAPNQGRVRALAAEEGDMKGSSWKSEMNLAEFINRGNGKTASKKRREYRSRKQVEEIHDSSSVERHLQPSTQPMTKEPSAVNPDRHQQQQQHQHVTKDSAKVRPA